MTDRLNDSPCSETPPNGRRRTLAAVAGGLAAGIAGCMGAFGRRNESTPVPRDAFEADWPVAGGTPAHLGRPPSVSVPSPDDGLREAWTVELPGMVSSRPASVGLVAFVGQDDGTVTAVNTADGSVYWHASAGESAVTGGPTVVGHTLYVGTAGSETVALDARTGDERWRTANERGVRPGRAGDGFAPARAGDTVVTAYSAGKTALDALHGETGEASWNRETPTAPGGPVPVDGAVYTGVGAFALDDGGPRWTTAGDSRSGHVSPAVTDRAVVVQSRDGLVAKYDRLNGEVAWRRTLSAGRDTPPAVADGTVYAPGYALSLATGKVRWRLETGTVTAPLVGDGVGYIGTKADKRVLAVDLSTGERRWSTDLPGRAMHPPTAGSGHLLVATDLTLTAFQG